MSGGKQKTEPAFPWVVVRMGQEVDFPSIKAQEFFLWLSETWEVKESRPDLFSPNLDDSLRLFSFQVEGELEEIKKKVKAAYLDDTEISALAFKKNLDVALIVSFTVSGKLKFPTVKAQEIFLWLSDHGFVRESNVDLFDPSIDESTREFHFAFVGDLAAKELEEKTTARFEEDPEVLAVKVRRPIREAPQDTEDSGRKQVRQVRLDSRKLEELTRLTGELVILKEQITSVTGDLTRNTRDTKILDLSKILRKAIQGLHGISEELQERTRTFQQIPIGSLLQRFQRVARDTARKLEKQIECHIQGEETEVDGNVLDRVGDLLVHLVRNAVDHGIEPVETRKAAGKPEAGTITLQAFHEEDQVVIEVADDGGGADPEKIGAKALRLGLVDEKTLASMPEQEIMRLMFRSGFSTATGVSEVSGRGVGLDVVKSRVEELNGLIDVRSELHKGTTFTIRLPLSFSIVQALLVSASGETFALPLASVLRVSRIGEEEKSDIVRSGEVSFDEGKFPAFLLADRLVCGNVLSDQPGDAYLVEVGYGVERYGMLVDRVLGRREIVIRPLGKIPGRIPGTTGMATLGDGSIVVVLDPRHLTNKAPSKSLEEEA